MFKGKIVITNQCGGFSVDTVYLEGTYKNKSYVNNKLRELGRKIEHRYSIYTNYEYIVEPA
jgi:hypothetical protein